MKLRISFAMLAIYLIWGSTYLAIRFAVETIPPFLMAGTRFLFPGLLLLIWRRLAGDPPPTRRQWISAAVVGLLLLLGGNGLVSWAEQRIHSGIAALVVGTAPIWMVLIDSLFASRQRPRLAAIIGLGMGFIGIIVLIGPKTILGGEGSADLLGIGAVLLASMLWSAGSVYSQKADMPASPLIGTGMEMLAGSAGLFLTSFLTGEWQTFQPAAISLRSILGLLYLILAGSLVGFVAYTWLLRNAPISLVSTYAYVNPLVAILLGYWLGQEELTLQVLFAATIIIGSVILINWGKRQTSVAPSKNPQNEVIPGKD